MCCLTCKFFSPTEPEAHKIARQSGSCEASCGKVWNWATAFRYTRAHKNEPLQGICLHTPTGVNKASWGVCGQHLSILKSGDNGWGVWSFDEGDKHDSLIEWAEVQFRVIRDNADPRHKRWHQIRNDELEAQNRLLRDQLAAARKRSATRLARLQKAASKKSKFKPPLLKLVAAE